MKSTPQVPVGCQLFTFLWTDTSTGIMSFLSIVSAMGVCRPPRSSRQGLTADPNATVEPFQDKAMPVILTTSADIEQCLEEPRTKHADVN